MVVYLSHYQLLPEDRLAELMADLFAVALVPGDRRADGPKPRPALRRRRRGDPRLGEIGAGQAHGQRPACGSAGGPKWLHVASSAGLTFYRVSAGRGSLLDGVAGIVVHDHWKPYFTMQGVDHALCNAHHLRELQALIEIEKEGWARKMQRLLRRALPRGKPRPGSGAWRCNRASSKASDDGGTPITAEGHPLSRGPAPARPRTGRGPGQAPWTQAAPYRPQPSPTSSGAQGRRATLPRQPRRALHQQSGRAGRAHGEAQAENLRRLPIRTRGERLRDHPRLHLDRQKTGLETSFPRSWKIPKP